MKPSLHDMQKDFLKAVKSRDFGALKANLIQHGGPISPEKRFDIYASAYWIRMNESLRDDYPQLCDKLEDQMAEIIFEYLQEFPSSYSGLAEVSKNLPQFISKYYPEHQELVHLEYAMLQSKNSGWPMIFERNQIYFIKPEELFSYQSEATDVRQEEEIQLLWNTSLVISNSTIVFQRNNQTEALLATPLELWLLSQSHRIQNFKKLIEELAGHTDSFEEIQILFKRFAENEILFFMCAAPKPN